VGARTPKKSATAKVIWAMNDKPGSKHHKQIYSGRQIDGIPELQSSKRTEIKEIHTRRAARVF